MERKKIGTKISVSTDFAAYSYMLNGIAGIGKTTTAVDVGQLLYGVDGVLLYTVGKEPKPEHMGNVLNNDEGCPNFETFEEDMRLFVKYKNEDYPALKILVIDSANEVFRLAEDYILRTYNEENPTKKVKAFKAAYGGFQTPENMVVDLVVKTIFQLNEAGICPFVIGHTKKKNVKDLQTDIEYEVTTSDLDSKYYNAIKDRVSIVACAYMEREMNDVETVKDAFTKKNKKVGRIKSERRILSFRDEEFAIDNKSHLKFIEAKVGFTATGFIKAVQDAIKKQIEYYNLPVAERLKIDAEMEAKAKEEAKQNEETIADDDPLGSILEGITSTKNEDAKKEEALIVDKEKNEALKVQITEILKELGAKGDKSKAPKVKDILTKYGASKITDIDKPTKMFEDILELLNN